MKKSKNCLQWCWRHVQGCSLEGSTRARQNTQHLSASPLILNTARSSQKDPLSPTEATRKKCTGLHIGINKRETEQTCARGGTGVHTAAYSFVPTGNKWGGADVG